MDSIQHVSGVEDLSPESAPWVVYQRMLRSGELGYQKCRSCHSVVFYPRVICPDCGSDELVWLTSSGRGTVYSVTTVHDRRGEYNVSLVDLEEGFRMMTNVVDSAPDSVFIGDHVRLRIKVGDDTGLPQFVKDEAAP